MKNHREEYVEVKNGAITYFKNANREDNVINLYEQSKDLNKKMKIVAIVNQKESHKKVFLNSIEEFERLKDEIEQKSPKAKVVEKENEEGEIEIDVQEDYTDESNNVETEKDVSTQIDELEEKAKNMEEAGNLLLSDINSLNKMKNSLMSESVDLGIIVEERMRYEQAQDKMTLITAEYMIEKNILVARREAVILNINRAIAEGDDISGLQDLLISLNGQIEDLDAECEEVLPNLQKEVSSAYCELQNASKEVMKKVSADFKNSYKRIRNYSEDGILQSESTDLTKNLNRVVLNTAYDASVVSDGKLPAINAQTININGQTVRVVSTEHAHGVDASFMDGNVEQMRAGSRK